LEFEDWGVVFGARVNVNTAAAGGVRAYGCLKVWVQDVWHSGFQIQGADFRVQGQGFGVQSLGFDTFGLSVYLWKPQAAGGIQASACLPATEARYPVGPLSGSACAGD